MTNSLVTDNNSKFNHFSNIGTTTNPLRNREFSNCISPCITYEDNAMLWKPISLETRETIKSMKSWTAPGPDGFPWGFYKENLEILDHDVWNTTKDFKPISLCNTNYKVISKMIINMMKPLLSKIISPFQAAFVPNRNIHNNVFIGHEIVPTMKRKKSKSGIMDLKPDMFKAFDRVEWSFLIDVLKCFGFSSHWCELILKCI